jgi:hypothetical protein
LSVPRYDFNWQHTYRFAEPLAIPRGTKLHCIAHWDNSERNPANPDPKKTVKFGPQSWDEMMVGQLEYIVPVGQRQDNPARGAQSEEERGHIQGFAKVAAAEAAKLPVAKWKSDPDPDKTAIARIAGQAMLVIPDKMLSEAALGKIGKEVMIVGQLWLKGMAPAIDGKASTPDSFQEVLVPIGQDRHLALDLCMLGVRRNADDWQLVILARDRELLAVPLKKAVGKKGLPIELDAKQVKGRASQVTVHLLGQYQATLPVIISGP